MDIREHLIDPEPFAEDIAYLYAETDRRGLSRPSVQMQPFWRIKGAGKMRLAFGGRAAYGAVMRPEMSADERRSEIKETLDANVRMGIAK